MWGVCVVMSSARASCVARPMRSGSHPGSWWAGLVDVGVGRGSVMLMAMLVPGGVIQVRERRPRPAFWWAAMMSR